MPAGVGTWVMTTDVWAATRGPAAPREQWMTARAARIACAVLCGQWRRLSCASARSRAMDTTSNLEQCRIRHQRMVVRESAMDSAVENKIGLREI